MPRKGTTQVREATVEAREVSRALTKTRTLTGEEEKVVRMRHGARVATDRPLARHGEGNAELQDELLLIEMELLRAWKQHLAEQQQRARVAPQPSRTKDKIVRALRRMK